MHCQRQMQVYSLVLHVNNISTHFGLLTLHDNTKLAQRLARQLLADWQIQAIGHCLYQCWPPQMPRGINLRALSVGDLKISLKNWKLHFKIVSRSLRDQWVKHGQDISDRQYRVSAPVTGIPIQIATCLNAVDKSLNLGGWPLGMRSFNDLVDKSIYCEGLAHLSTGYNYRI